MSAPSPERQFEAGVIVCACAGLFLASLALAALGAVAHPWVERACEWAQGVCR